MDQQEIMELLTGNGKAVEAATFALNCSFGCGSKRRAWDWAEDAISIVGRFSASPRAAEVFSTALGQGSWPDTEAGLSWLSRAVSFKLDRYRGRGGTLRKVWRLNETSVSAEKAYRTHGSSLDQACLNLSPGDVGKGSCFDPKTFFMAKDVPTWSYGQVLLVGPRKDKATRFIRIYDQEGEDTGSNFAYRDWNMFQPVDMETLRGTRYSRIEGDRELWKFSFSNHLDYSGYVVKRGEMFLLVESQPGFNDLITWETLDEDEARQASMFSIGSRYLGEPLELE